MIKLGTSEPDSSPGNFTYLSGLGLVCYAQNYRGDWVRQVKHRISAPVGTEDDIQRARFVDKVLKRMARKGAQ